MPNRLPLTRDVKEIIDAGSMTGRRWAVVGLCFPSVTHHSAM